MFYIQNKAHSAFESCLVVIYYMFIQRINTTTYIYTHIVLNRSGLFFFFLHKELSHLYGLSHKKALSMKSR